jgi:predicted NUDIX family phosphoesterase
MAQEEQVLVVETKVLEMVGTFQGLAFDVKRYLRELFAPGIPQFIPRSQAEPDPSYKQIIPYVIMTHDGKILSYVRGKRAGEKRLTGLRSLGIGGHINPVDEIMPLFEKFYKTYLTAVQREVDEEVCVETNHTDRVAALLNDDSNEVGSVHLGIVHLWELEAPQVSKREQMITQMEFLSPAQLHEVRDTMETWSQKCLDGFDMMNDSGIELHDLF